MTGPTVLAVNAGSASLKVARFARGEETARETVDLDPGAAADALADVVARLGRGGPEAPDAPDVVGHRIVHGGPHHVAPALVDDALVDGLRELTPLAPLHQPEGLAVLEAARARYPDVPHVACFDTAFHRSLPEVAQRFAIDDRWWQAGVRRYGFHGLSYEYLTDALPEVRRGRAVLAHLGGGSSMVALLDGVPQETTMGLTPTGGLVMGTRSGDLDPGVLIYLARSLRADCPDDDAQDVDALDALERELNRDAGILAVAGAPADARSLLARRARDPRAALALDLFCRSARSHIGALTAVLGGLDHLVFTGGIGAHSAPLRAEICAELEHLGVVLDAERNEQGSRPISTDGAACRTLAVETDEESVIARHARDVVAARR